MFGKICVFIAVALLIWQQDFIPKTIVVLHDINMRSDEFYRDSHLVIEDARFELDIYSFNKCKLQWLDSKINYRYGNISGCSIQTLDGRWIPAENYNPNK